MWIVTKCMFHLNECLKFTKKKLKTIQNLKQGISSSRYISTKKNQSDTLPSMNTIFNLIVKTNVRRQLRKVCHPSKKWLWIPVLCLLLLWPGMTKIINLINVLFLPFQVRLFWIKNTFTIISRSWDRVGAVQRDFKFKIMRPRS